MLRTLYLYVMSIELVLILQEELWGNLYLFILRGILQCYIRLKQAMEYEVILRKILFLYVVKLEK